MEIRFAYRVFGVPRGPWDAESSIRKLFGIERFHQQGRNRRADNRSRMTISLAALKAHLMAAANC